MGVEDILEGKKEQTLAAKLNDGFHAVPGIVAGTAAACLLNFSCPISVDALHLDLNLAIGSGLYAGVTGSEIRKRACLAGFAASCIPEAFMFMYDEDPKIIAASLLFKMLGYGVGYLAGYCTFGRMNKADREY